MLSAIPNRLNRFATIAVIPLLVFGAMLAARSGESSAGPADLSSEGLLVVANLQSRDLTIYNFDRGALPQTLTLPGRPHEIARLGERLYITLGRSGLVVEVDPFAPAILRSVPLDGHPHGIAIDSAGIHVTLDEADEVVTLDWSTLAVTGRVPVGDTPHVIATRQGAWFVTDSRDGQLRKVDGLLSTSVPAGALPEAVAVTGSLVVIADAEGGAIHAFEADTLVPAATTVLPGRPVRIMGMGSVVLVTRNHAASLAVLATPSLALVADVPVGAFPDGICESPSGRFVAVPSNGDGLVTIVGVERWDALGSLRAGSGPGACAWIAAN